ncbi:MAG: RecQ family ATP-dependent DNA helicase, partial [Planctomycetales bacterium]|nr:RecQ family ATP-dependent DNA helicase [Planctomycetales bacterium]
MANVSLEPNDYLHRFGISEFRPGQRDVVEAVLSGHDCLCIMPTGGGKSLCYQLPSLMREGVTLVVSPLIALMKDQVDTLVQRGISASFINSTLDSADQSMRLDQLAAGEFDLMYVAPERFRSPRFQEALVQAKVQLLAVDEAHCISEWGHDFRHDYAKLGTFRKKIGSPQTIALTATATDDVRKDVVVQLDLNEPKTFIAGFARPNLQYAVQTHASFRDKIEALQSFLKENEGCGVIYASTRKGCEEIAESVGMPLGRKVVVYHAGLAMDDRRKVQDAFMSGKADIVVATNAFGMGIDKPDVRFVVHYNIPGTLEAYYQEAGRAGRDGKPSQCLLLYSPSDRYIQEFFIDSANPAPETIHAVYEFLRYHEGDPIELTQEELKEEANLSIGSDGVGTCERVLEKCGVLERLEPNRNMAAVRLSTDIPTIADLIPPQAKNRRKVAKAIESVVGPRRHELVYFRPPDLARMIGMDIVKFTRSLREITSKLECVDYVPPFRGRAVRMIRRDLEFDQLDIDFTEIEARRKLNFGKLDRVVKFATTSQCRQQQVLDYFGEKSSDPRRALRQSDERYVHSWDPRMSVSGNRVA